MQNAKPLKDAARKQIAHALMLYWHLSPDKATETAERYEHMAECCNISIDSVVESIRETAEPQR